MGQFESSLQGYIHVYKMNTFAQIDFQQEIQRQLEVAKAAGQQQQLAQVANVGGIGGGGSGGGGFWSAITPWGDRASIWIGLSNMLQTLAVPLVPLFAILTAVTWLVGLAPWVIFLNIFLCAMFAMAWVQYNMTSPEYITTPRPTMFSIVGGLIVGSAVTLILYSPGYNSEPEKLVALENKSN